MDFSNMNETDVREEIVRPLLHDLGYRRNTLANIRTEVPLRYDNAFLGRKKPNDPPLRGRADYICEATSYGRWTVEVKSPTEELDRDAIEQAHTYSAHPEIAASHFLLTNGREFALYATAQLERPLLAFSYDKLGDNILPLRNAVGYEALKRLNSLMKPNQGKPLGENISSTMEIIGGEIRYGSHRSSHPLFNVDVMNGLIAPITGGLVDRSEDGRLRGRVHYRSGFAQFDALNRLVGFGDITFFCADEYISTSRESPSKFQNVQFGRLERGTPIPLIPGMPPIPTPVSWSVTCTTEAILFAMPDSVQGVLFFDYQYEFDGLSRIQPGMPDSVSVQGDGTFSMRVGRQMA